MIVKKKKVIKHTKPFSNSAEKHFDSFAIYFFYWDSPHARLNSGENDSKSSLVLLGNKDKNPGNEVA